jgi:hypothetical protein
VAPPSGRCRTTAATTVSRERVDQHDTHALFNQERSLLNGAATMDGNRLE